MVSTFLLVIISDSISLYIYFFNLLPVIIVKAVWKRLEYSLRSCFQQFRNEYPDVMAPDETFKSLRNRLVQRFMETGSVTKRKSEQAPSVLTEDTVDDIRQRMNVSPNKSVRKLAIQTGVSRGSAHTALKNAYLLIVTSYNCRT